VNGVVAYASLMSELVLASLMNWSSMLLRRSLRLSSGATGFSTQPSQLFAVNFANPVGKVSVFRDDGLFSST
jgi:hypothetical protein